MMKFHKPTKKEAKKSQKHREFCAKYESIFQKQFPKNTVYRTNPIWDSIRSLTQNFTRPDSEIVLTFKIYNERKKIVAKTFGNNQKTWFTNTRINKIIEIIKKYKEVIQ
jgi:hypothetical protein